MVLEQKAFGPMEQNKEPRKKLTHLWSVNLPQRRQKYTMGKREFIQQVILGKLDSHMQVNEVRELLHIIHKNKLKLAQRLNYRTQYHQIPRREHRHSIL